MNTAIRNAFFSAKFPPSFAGTKLCAALLKVAQTNSGVRRIDKGWTAKLSYRTALKLKADGVIS